MYVRNQSLREYRNGSSPIPVYSFVGNSAGLRTPCGCRKCRGLGDNTSADDVNDFPDNYNAAGSFSAGAPTGLTQSADASGYTQAQLAAMWNQPDTPLTLNPVTGIPYATSGVGPYATQAAISAPVLSLPAPILTNPASSPLNLSGVSSTTLLLGAIGLVAVVLIAKKR